MSHAWGKVFQLPGRSLVGRFEYNGTADIAHRAILSTEEEIRAVWRTEGSDRECICEAPVTAAVELYADYGNGITWESEACLRCMTITGNRDPYAEVVQALDVPSVDVEFEPSLSGPTAELKREADLMIWHAIVGDEDLPM